MFKRLSNRCFLFMLSCLCFFTLSPSSNLIHAEEAIESEESSLTESMEEEPEEKEEPQEDKEQEITESQAAPVISFPVIVPYAQFVEYVYAGDEVNFPSCHLIMEFTPDSNGIFQLAAMGNESTTAYVYQLRQDGLYELAYFEDYTLVEDLRYTDEAMDGQEALVLPSQLAVGQSFQAGPNYADTYTVLDVLTQVNIANQTYYDVVKIKASRSEGEFYYYFAPNLGLIAVEAVGASGETTTVLHLQRASGFIN